MNERKCFANHLGPWLIESQWFAAALAAVKSGSWPLRAAAQQDVKAEDRRYAVRDGVAVISIDGPMAKFDSKYGGTNTVRVRTAVRQAMADAGVGAIMLRIDSPGGHVAGTKELADDVRTAASMKPTYAYGEDQLASAAYWVAAQTKKIYSNETGEIGSVGTIAVIEDSSEAFKMEGIAVHVISTGEYKGAFADGTPVTPEQLDYARELVADINEHFLRDVADGRKMEMKAVRELADGRMHIASKAKRLGLIDAVMSFDSAMGEASEAAQKKLSQRSNRNKAQAIILLGET